jgi:surface polysaccharide O-acyltransferase-like enzyme
LQAKTKSNTELHISEVVDEKEIEKPTNEAKAAHPRPHTRSQRDSNLELLRILAMLLIIGDHLGVHSGTWPTTATTQNPVDYTLHHLFVLNMQMGGQVGVTAFVLISGFFLCTSRFKLSRILKVELQMLIFSIVITVICAIINPPSVSSYQWFQAFFPTTFKTWWFATVYIVLVALSPFINKLLGILTRREHLALVAVLFAVMSLLPTLTNDAFVIADYLGRFVFLYCLAAYLRFYPDCKPMHFHPLALIGAAIVFYVLPSLIMPLYANYNKSNPWYPLITWFLRSSPNHERIFTLFAALCLFMAFKQFRLGNNRVINFVSGTTFGIYLFSDHPFVRPGIWTHVVHAATWYSSNWFFLYCIGAVVAVFIVGAVIDTLRKYAVQDPLESAWSHVWPHIQPCLRNWAQARRIAREAHATRTAHAETSQTQTTFAKK